LRVGQDSGGDLPSGKPSGGPRRAVCADLSRGTISRPCPVGITGVSGRIDLTIQLDTLSGLFIYEDGHSYSISSIGMNCATVFQ
jgi:hypothetical protein